MAWRPTRIGPANAGVAPTADGLAEYLAGLDVPALLAERGAVLLRGFRVTPDTLGVVLEQAVPQRLPYVPGRAPRTRVGRRVYTASEYPSDQIVPVHSELSYLNEPPGRLLMFCDMAPVGGGATILADTASWLRALDPEIRAAFAAGLCYRHVLPHQPSAGLSWPQAFETKDRSAVEAYLAGSGASWEWSSGGLRIEQRRAAIVRHPRTGVEVWFNQSDRWPGPTVTFADGSEIPAGYRRQVRERGLAIGVDLHWRRGDVLLIDNVLIGHGRRAYDGVRRLLLAMSR